MDTTNGHDINPNEMVVTVLTGFTAESEPVYERCALHRPAGSVFSEPIDYSESPRPPPPQKITPEHQKYQSERERLKTFELVWKPEYHVTKEDLAQDGFIYKGPGDRALCVFCLKSIKGWEPSDTVQGEHKRLFPKCPWVCGKVHHLNKPISISQLLKKDMGLSSKGLPQFTDMSDIEARQSTYNSWPRGRRMTAGVLAKAGFFHDDFADSLVCYYCGLKVKSFLDETELNQEHVKKSCPLVNSQQSNARELGAAAGGNFFVSEENAIGEVKASVSTQIEEDMKGVAVQAISESCADEYSMADIRRAVEEIRLTNGSDGSINYQDIMEMLDKQRPGDF